MHEIAICEGIIKTVEAELDICELSLVREIHLKVGALSCVEPSILKHVFTFIKADSSLENASLVVEVVDVQASCANCRQEFVVEKFRFICPACGHPVEQIMAGKELLIHKIVLQDMVYEEVN